MEEWKIVASLIVPVIAWLALMTIQHTKKLAVMEKNAASTDVALTSIKDSLEKMSQRFDLFLKNEIEVLKDLAKR